MQFSTKNSLPERLKTGCVVVPVLAGNVHGSAGALVERLGEGRVRRLLAAGDLNAKPGSTLLVHVDGGIERLLLVSLGDEPAVSDKAFLDAARAVARHLSQLPRHDALSLLCEVPMTQRGTGWKLRAQVLAAREAAYRFDRMKSKPETAERGPRALQILVDRREQALADRELLRAVALADGMDLAKDLGNLPGNVCTPTYLAEQAKELAREFGMRVDVLGQKQMQALKMGSLLAVAQGSEQPPRLIVLQYQGGAKSQAPVALVGKGVTFDTGGISLKPGAEMDEMKYDMCGAASVLGTLRAVAAMKLPINVVGIIPAVENMPSGRAIKPGDVVTSLSGQTIEILNTDAEGRLILCDALTYARRFKPSAVVDIATLTGACVIALGNHHTGLFTRTDALAAELQDAGREMQDTAWRMPLDDEYQDLLKSNFADMANIGGRAGGAITAACFLARFTKDMDWAHLDIAGTAWKSGANKGASGRPVPLLTRFLIGRAEG